MMKLSASLEDYLETIYLLCKKQKVARVKEIAKSLKVKDASVVGALRLLRARSLIEQERYGYVRLTREGVKKAREVSRRHTALARFLKEVLELDESTASVDACLIEHNLSELTLKRISALVDFFGSSESLKSQRWRDSLRDYILKRG